MSQHEHPRSVAVPRRRSAPDEGSALTLAIVFITVVGLAAALALGYASATLRATGNAYAPARDKLYAADSAVKAAVQYVVNNKSEGTYTSAGTCSPERSFGTVRGEAVKVQVCPQSGSLTQDVQNADFSLIARPSGTDDGVQVSGNGTMTVNGSILSSTGISVGSNGGSGSGQTVLESNAGTVAAKNGCSGSGTIKVDGVVYTGCTAGADPTSDPGYTLSSTWGNGLTVRSANYCNSTTSIATLPGNSAWVDGALKTAIDNCAFVVMLPGYHYIESYDWTITNRVVAGTIVSNDAKNAATGKACDPTQPGATLVLGATTTIRLSGPAASLEVCGQNITQASGKVMRLPFYGLTADATRVDTNTLTTSTNPTGTGWTNPANAKAIDSSVATITVPKNTSASQPLSLSGWTGTPAIPSSVTKLAVTVNGVSSSPATFGLAVVNNDGNTACASSGTAMPTGSAVSATTEATVNMTCTRTLSGPYTVRLTLTTPNTGSSRDVKIDGLTIKWDQTVTFAKAQSGCVTTPLSGGGNGACAVLKSDGNTNKIYFDGYVSMPKGFFDLQLPKDALFWVTEGMIVRVLRVQVTGSTSISPTVAANGAKIKPGDVVVTAKIGTTTWVSCRVTFTISGSTVTGSTITNCTRPS